MFVSYRRSQPASATRLYSAAASDGYKGQERGGTMDEATISEGETMKETINARGDDGDQNERR